MLAVLVSLLLLGAAFAILHGVARRLDNYGVVDVGWAFAFAPLALAGAILGDGWLPRRLLFALLIVAWSLRLGLHLMRRVARLHPREDGRYEQLRRAWGPTYVRRMAGFFQLQALSVVLLLIPFWPVWSEDARGWHGLEIVGASLWLLAWFGSWQADRQLARHAGAPDRTPGSVCRDGWWRYSRHPNYFFEWCGWCGWALFATASAGGWVAWASPAVMLYLILRVTGIPPTEAQALRTRGEAYRDYQRTTSAFVPWPPRSAQPLSS